MSDIIWPLWLEQEREEDEDAEPLIGVYWTEEAAKGAIERLKDQLGHEDHLQGFPDLLTYIGGGFVDRRICKGLVREIAITQS
jgi:hypothetical protein